MARACVYTSTRAHPRTIVSRLRTRHTRHPSSEVWAWSEEGGAVGHQSQLMVQTSRQQTRRVWLAAGSRRGQSVIPYRGNNDNDALTIMIVVRNGDRLTARELLFLSSLYHHLPFLLDTRKFLLWYSLVFDRSAEKFPRNV